MILRDDFQNEFLYCLFIIISLFFIAFGTLIFTEILKSSINNEDSDGEDNEDNKESFSQTVKDQE